MNKCHVVEDSCYCKLDVGHEGPHACKCGGQWDFNEEGNFLVVELPRIDTPRFFHTMEEVKIVEADKRDPRDNGKPR